MRSDDVLRVGRPDLSPGITRGLLKEVVDGDGTGLFGAHAAGATTLNVAAGAFRSAGSCRIDGVVYDYIRDGDTLTIDPPLAADAEDGEPVESLTPAGKTEESRVAVVDLDLDGDPKNDVHAVISGDLAGYYPLGDSAAGALVTVSDTAYGYEVKGRPTDAPLLDGASIEPGTIPDANDAIDLANAAAAAAADAAANATLAMTSADGKTKITISLAGPGSTPNTAGVDVWWQKESVTQTIIGQWVGLGGTSWQPVTLNDAVIANLSAGKITAGSAFTNALSVKTNFTLGDASTNGVIQSYDFASSPVGVYIDKFGLVAKGGSITGADIIGGTFKTSDPSEHLEISHDAVYTGTQLRFLYDLDQVAKIVAWGTGAAPGIRISGEQQAILALDADSTNTDSIALDYNDTSHIINLRSTKGILLSAGTGTVDVSGPIVATGDITATGAGDVHGQFCFSDNAAGGGLTGASINNDGRIQRTTSSRRYKDNIETLTDDELDRVAEIRVVTFTRTDGPGVYMGGIAEEVAELDLPHLVFHNTDGDVEGIHYDGLAAAALAYAQREAARKDQQIAEQATQINALTSALADAVARITALEGSEPNGS